MEKKPYDYIYFQSIGVHSKSQMYVYHPLCIKKRKLIDWKNDLEGTWMLYINIILCNDYQQGIWGFPKMVVPPKRPKMIIFSRKTHGC